MFILWGTSNKDHKFLWIPLQSLSQTWHQRKCFLPIPYLNCRAIEIDPIHCSSKVYTKTIDSNCRAVALAKLVSNISHTRHAFWKTAIAFQLIHRASLIFWAKIWLSRIPLACILTDTLIEQGCIGFWESVHVWYQEKLIVVTTNALLFLQSHFRRILKDISDQIGAK